MIYKDEVGPMHCRKCQAFEARVGDLCEYCAHDEKAHPEGEPCECLRVSVLGLEFIQRIKEQRV